MGCQYLRDGESEPRAFGGLCIPSFGNFSHDCALPPAPRPHHARPPGQPPPRRRHPNCNPTTTADCKAKVITSAERLMSLEASVGHAEHRKSARLLEETPGIQDELLGKPASPAGTASTTW